MKRNLTRGALGALAGLTLSCSAHAFDLTIDVLDAPSNTGMVLAAVYASDADWLNADKAIQKAGSSTQTTTRLVVHGLAAGRYAVSLFHDANGNGRLDTNVIGLPTERFGFSRDAMGSMGPASFKDAAVDVQRDTTITVHLR